MKPLLFYTMSRRQVILISVLFILFILLAYLVIAYPASNLDLQVSRAIQEHHSPLKDQCMVFISAFGHTTSSALMAAIVAAVFYLFKFRREALFTVITLSSGLISSLVKYIVNRPRPGKDFVRIVEVAKQQSFPSGHMMFYTIFFGFVILAMLKLTMINRLIRIIVITISAWMIILVPFSRIYLGAHWLTDVAGGFLLGTICLIILSHCYFASSSPGKSSSL